MGTPFVWDISLNTLVQEDDVQILEINFTAPNQYICSLAHKSDLASHVTITSKSLWCIFSGQIFKFTCKGGF